MRELRAAGVGVLCSSWWGKDSPTDRILPKLLDAAARHGLKVNIHIEPFPGRNASTTRRAVVYILEAYRTDILPENTRNFAVFAAGLLDGIRKLPAEISEYLLRLEEVPAA
jgi:hypothetical protein